MAQNFDLTQTGPELQARVDQVFPNRDAIEQETVTREAQDESLETSLKAYTDTEQARAEAVEGALDTRVSANEVDIDLLKSQYEALTQSDIIVGPLPSTGQPNKIYRVPGSTYYTDYMWANGGWVKLAEYSTLDGYVYKGIATPSGTPVQSAEAVFYFAVQPGTYTNYGGLVVTDTIAILKYNGTEWTKDDVITIDDEPTAGSDNLVKSGGVNILISAQKPNATKEAVYIYPSTGEKSEGGSSWHTYFFNNRNYDRLAATICGGSASNVAIAFYSGEVSSSTYMKDYTVLCSGNYNRYKENVSANIPFGCKIIAIVSRVPQNDVTEDDIQFNLHLGGRDLTYLEQDIKDLNTEIQDLNTEIQGISKTEEDYEPMANGVYIGVDGSLIPNSSMKSYSIQNSGFTKISGKVSVRNTRTPYVGFYDSEEPSADSFISGIVFSDQGVHEFSSLIPLGTLSIVLYSDKRISDTLEFEISKESVDERFKSLNEEINAIEKPKVLYVSPNGNDNNSGESLTKALATVDGALHKGCEVVLLDDGIYNQDINVSLCKEYKITIKPAFDGARPIFKNPHTTYITDDVLTESGKVKKVVLSEDIDSGVLYLFVENVPDATTAISEAERHPLQRGKEYRLENTIIKKLRNVSDSSIAIETIESSDAYSWWYDATNKTLYFSAPVDIDSSHPLVITSRSYGLLKNTSRNHSIVMQDIESWYGAIMLYNMSDAELYGCSAKYICHSGGIAWDLTTCVKLIRCEAAAVAYISNGDGFNGHAKYNAETAFSEARMCTDITIDCWSHDNYDDGHSVHELCESTVIGGLYEYNGKFGVGGGIGAEYTLYNVTARSNYINYGESIGDDFTYDNPGSMTCHNCISLNAKYGGFSPFGSSEAQGNPIIDCVDCKSYNDYRNYRNNSVNGKVILRNCIAVNSSPEKYKDGSGTIEVINGDTVS